MAYNAKCDVTIVYRYFDSRKGVKVVQKILQFSGNYV